MVWAFKLSAAYLDSLGAIDRLFRYTHVNKKD